ncbi:type II secretion system protein GspL [Alkalimarinus alittae]|uniref:Type II secretion system protein L n=1 Tax=Alkalimarinus alittae TaxID=2961619 RepID=A0ABY6MXD0_9ALTE|nr:type II secretion system protein GspL [Alkalimarinus alittae]UZE94479.1 type II secretion system protein GspL [Alkalimarinus alittae]
MPNKLFIRALSLPEKEDEGLSNFEWALYARAGQKIAGGFAERFEDVQQLLDQNAIEDVQIIGLIPANIINSTQVTIPGKQSRYVQQALPFAVEDQLSEDIDSVHIALGDKLSNGNYSVEVISYDFFKLYFDALVHTGFTIHAIYSDASLLPIQGVDAVIGFENDWALVDIKPGTVSRVKRFNLVSYFESVLITEGTSEGTDKKKVSCYIPPEQADSLKIVLAELQQTEGFEWTTHDLNVPILELLCESWFQQGTKGINLCQGDFKIANASAPSFKKWKAVAAVAGIWFCLQVGVDLGKGYYYQDEAENYSQAALDVYKSLFPAERRVSVNNLRRTLQGKLNSANASQGNTDFLSLLSEAGYQYSKVPNNQTIEFKSVNYSDQRQELTIELRAGSFQQLDQLKNGLTDAGLGAKISSAINEQNSVRGRLSVTGS